MRLYEICIYIYRYTTMEMSYIFVVDAECGRGAKNGLHFASRGNLSLWTLFHNVRLHFFTTSSFIRMSGVISAAQKISYTSKVRWQRILEIENEFPSILRVWKTFIISL